MNTVLYTTMIKAYAKTKNMTKVLEVFGKMKREKSNTPNNVTYNSVIDCCIKCEEYRLAEKMFEEMKEIGIKPDIITFSTLIKGCLKNTDLNKAVDYLSLMKKFDVQPDYVLLNSLLDGCEKMKKYHKAVEIFNYVRSFKVEPSMMAFSIMMKVFGRLNNFEESKLLMDEAKRKKGNISLIIFTCFIKTCFSTHHIEEAMKTFASLKVFNLTPDIITYTTMLNGLLAKKSSSNLSEVLLDSLNNNIRLPDSYYQDSLIIIKKKNDGKDEMISRLMNDNGIVIGEIHTTKKEETNYLLEGYKHKNGKTSNRNFTEKTDTPTPLSNRNQLTEKGQYYKSFNNFVNVPNMTTSSNYKSYNCQENEKFVIVKQEQSSTTNEKFKRSYYPNSTQTNNQIYTDKTQSQTFFKSQNYYASNNSIINSNQSFQPAFEGKENKTVKKINRF